jgi:hypothetical protein
VAVTVSDPVGALVEVHEAVPDLRATLQSVTEPTVNATVPPGVPEAEVTLAL